MINWMMNKLGYVSESKYQAQKSAADKANRRWFEEANRADTIMREPRVGLQETVDVLQAETSRTIQTLSNELIDLVAQLERSKATIFSLERIAYSKIRYKNNKHLTKMLLQHEAKYVTNAA